MNWAGAGLLCLGASFACWLIVVAISEWDLEPQQRTTVDPEPRGLFDDRPADRDDPAGP